MLKKDRKKILGVNVDFGLTKDQAVKEIERLISKGEGSHLVATTSPYFIMSANKNPEFKKIINKAVLSVPDGVGVLYANYYLNKLSKIKRGVWFPIKALLAGLSSGVEGFIDEKEFGKTITGVELTHELCKLSAKKGYSIFLLGGDKRDSKGKRVKEGSYDMAEEAKEELMSLYPNVNIIGATSQFNKLPIDDNKTLLYIHSCMKRNNINNIDILLVAYNPIQQEEWIQRNASKIPSRISVGIGRTLNYITNDMKQPNKMYEKMHLMWLYTFIIQPWRVKRVLMTFPKFPIKVFLESIKS